VWLIHATGRTAQNEVKYPELLCDTSPKFDPVPHPSLPVIVHGGQTPAGMKREDMDE
jgi:hypothetical protein